jgi:hypothetical protein
MQDDTLFVSTGTGLFKVQDGRVANMGLPDGGGGLRCPVVIDKDDARRLYAGTSRAGVYVSEDGGSHWRPSSAGLDKPQVWWLEQHPRSGELWAGVSPSAMYKSADRAETWAECRQLQTLPTIAEWSFPPPPHISHVKHFSLREDDANDVVAAVEEGWVIRTTDGGETWENLRNGCEFDAHAVYFMPDNPRVIVTTSGKGVYRSENGGESFVETGSGMDRHYLTHLVVNGRRPNLMFTAAAEVPPPGWTRPQGGESAFYRSEDQGRNWQRLRGGLPEHMVPAPRCAAGDPSDPEHVLFGLTDASVWETRDAGESFARVLDLRSAQRPGEHWAQAVTSMRIVH